MYDEEVSYTFSFNAYVELSSKPKNEAELRRRLATALIEQLDNTPLDDLGDMLEGIKEAE